MTPDEIEAWAARLEERVAEGIMTGPGEPTRMVGEALRLLAEKRRSAEHTANVDSGEKAPAMHHAGPKAPGANVRNARGMAGR